MGVGRSVGFFVFQLLVWSLLAQEQQFLTLTFENEPLLDALDRLDKVTDQQLSYNPKVLPNEALINASFEHASAESILSVMLGPGYEFKQIGVYLIIQKKIPVRKQKGTYEIKGGIRDASTGQELQDVSIYEVNTLQSTLSDESGAFELKADTEFEEATFVISKRFYQDTIIRMSKARVLSEPIVLQEEKKVQFGEAIRERVKVYSNGLAKFFTSKRVRQNAQNINFVDTRWAQISLVPSIGTNRKLSSQVRNKISLNLISGYSYGVRGVELGGVYNISREEVRGVQVGGFGNAVGGEVKGLQMSGFINTTRDYVEGAQIGGFINIASDSVSGFQMGGFSNITKDMSGLQIAGFNNHTRDMSGFQLSGFINTSLDIDGFQLAGFINKAKEVRGFQLSVINIADTVASGVPFGLINIVKNGGFISPAIESDDVIPLRVAFRSGVDKLYSILSGGILPGEYWSYGFGLGSRLSVSKKNSLMFNPELRWFDITENNTKENEDNNLVRLNVNLGYQLFKHLSVTAGPSINFFFTNQLDENNDPILQIAGNTLLDDKAASNRYQVWVGYSIGIGF